MNMTNPGTNASRQRLYIQEVAPRDGLQAEPLSLDVDTRVALIERLAAANSRFADVKQEH